MGNFWGDFAGAFQKSYDSAQRNSRENAAAKRDQERFDHEKQQWDEQDQQKVRIGAAGWTLDDPTKPDGLMTADDYNRQFAAPPAAKGKKRPATAIPTAQTTDAPAPQAAAMPAASAPSQPTTPQAPTAGDYMPVEVNGQVMYAPKTRVKMKDPSTYVADVGRVMMSIDPTVGANMMAAAQTLESNNLKLASQRWGNAVIQAQRLGGDAGLQQLSKLYDDLPDGQSVQWSRDKDGGVHLKFYADTQGGPVQTSERVFKGRQGLTAEQEVFEHAAALASPESMGQYLTTIAQAAQTEFTNVLAIKQDKRADERLALDRQQTADAKARGWASIGLQKQELEERRAERLGTGPTSKIRAAATARLDKLLTAAQLDPTAPDYEQQYNAALKNILRAHPEIGAALHQADFTEQDQAPAKPKAAIPGFVAPMNGSPRAGGTPDPRKDPDVWTSPVTGRLSRYSNPKFVSPRDQAAAERQQQMMGEARGILRMGGAIRQSYEQQFQQKYGATVEQVLQQER